MTETCALCGELITIVDPLLLGYGGENEAYMRLASAVGKHIQQRHLEEFKSLIQSFVAFQFLLYAYFVVDREGVEGGWRADRQRALEYWRKMFAENRPVVVNQVQPLSEAQRIAGPGTSGKAAG